MKFLSPIVALYLYISTILPCMEHCCYVWAGALSSYLDMQDKLQKRVCRTVRPTLAASLEPLGHVEKYPAEVISIGITLSDVHLNWLDWFLFLAFMGCLLVILID